MSLPSTYTHSLYFILVAGDLLYGADNSTYEGLSYQLCFLSGQKFRVKPLLLYCRLALSLFPAVAWMYTKRCQIPSCSDLSSSMTNVFVLTSCHPKSESLVITSRAMISLRYLGINTSNPLWPSESLSKLPSRALSASLLTYLSLFRKIMKTKIGSLLPLLVS